MYSVEKPVDLLDQLLTTIPASLEFAVPASVIEELKNLLERGRFKERRLASLALKIAEKCRVVAEQDASKPADAVILERAKREGWVVVTNDRSLRRQLRQLGVPVVFIKNRLLKVEGDIL